MWGCDGEMPAGWRTHIHGQGGTTTHRNDAATSLSSELGSVPVSWLESMILRAQDQNA
jgi:hypothetical protein